MGGRAMFCPLFYHACKQLEFRGVDLFSPLTSMVFCSFFILVLVAELLV